MGLYLRPAYTTPSLGGRTYRKKVRPVFVGTFLTSTEVSTPTPAPRVRHRSQGRFLSSVGFHREGERQTLVRGYAKYLRSSPCLGVVIQQQSLPVLVRTSCSSLRW